MNQLDFAMIDPHIHQWDPYHTPHSAALLVKVLGKYPSLMDKVIRLVKPKPLLDTLGKTEHILSPYLPMHYRQDLGSFNVESVVHVEANWHHHKGFGVVEETRWLNQLEFSKHGLKLAAIVATADPSSRKFADILKAHQDASPMFRGIRKMAAWHEDDRIYRWSKTPHLYQSKKFLKGFEQLAKMNLSFDAWGYSTQLNEITALAKQFPETRIVVDHLATPVGLFGAVGKKTGNTASQRDVIFKQWQNDLCALAEQSNVNAKISGLMMPVLGHTFYKENRTATISEMVHLLAPLIQHAIEVFGTDRVMFASNYPMDKPNASLTDLIQAYITIIQPYGTQAMYSIFRQNAANFYQLDIN
ncbi:amidohydrolase family protein [Acinetobacter sp. NIPH 2699]|uniref:amidohydrolase family protein n=1 Tax=Acinetobacter sp. NIPH 2699 TaxID=2923433 RepID=UPI001F4B4EEA|nr:amidohydrolase family protein [Acinetobacter sp. NIPH 2699]MCH7335106.1 amidohydrolase family protein [Acinetobacter sp. NIPH 2699]